MKKNSKTTKTETPTGPSVKAIMYRIATVTRAAAQKGTEENRQEIFAEALRLIDEAAAQYWKHHANA